MQVLLIRLALAAAETAVSIAVAMVVERATRSD
jgi:NADH:ubiquinone oxidoreductase subunit K